ncbi:MAG: MFS transporter [Candidatus Muiribacteriota bacterium]
MLIFNNKNFGLLWFGQLISQLGDKIFSIAVAWYVLDITGSSQYVSYVMIFTFLPVILFSSFSGVFVDRLNRKKIIVISDILRGALILLLSYLIYTGIENFYVLYTIIFLCASVTSFFNPAISASIPSIVEEDNLEKAMAYQGSLRDMATVIGSGIGGVLVGFFGAMFSFLINGVCYLISAICEIPIKIPVSIKKEKNSFFKDMKEGFVFVLNHKTIKWMLITFMILNFFGPPIMIIIPVMVKQLQLGPEYLGYFQMIFAMGGVLGALSCTRITPKKKKILFITIVMVLSGLFMSLLGFFTQILILLALQFFIGVVLSWININLAVFFQKLTPGYIKGRFFAILENVAMLIVPFSFFIAGITIDYYGYALNLKVMGTCVILASFFFYFIPGLRSTDEAG